MRTAVGTRWDMAMSCRPFVFVSHFDDIQKNVSGRLLQCAFAAGEPPVKRRDGRCRDERLDKSDVEGIVSFMSTSNECTIQ